MKKFILTFASIIIAVLITFSSCSVLSSNNNDVQNDFQDDVQDWMKDQADNKDYDYDDGGSYYCMGKNDTCSNKTKNTYDLYCNSCDPDGDNVEG